MIKDVVPPSYTRLQSPYIAAPQRTVSANTESRELTLEGGRGNAYALSVERSTVSYSLSWDGTAGARDSDRGSGRSSHGPGKGPASLQGGLSQALRDMDTAVKGFRRIFQRLLHGAFEEGEYGAPRYANDPGAYGDMGQITLEVETVSVRIEAAGPPVDEYWSAPNTAGRLRDFAVGLYRGGDRQDHAKRMIKAMEAGYGQAKRAMGGALPEIADETIALARESIQSWAEKTELAAGIREGLDLVA